MLSGQCARRGRFVLETALQRQNTICHHIAVGRSTCRDRFSVLSNCACVFSHLNKYTKIVRPVRLNDQVLGVHFEIWPVHERVATFVEDGG